MARRKGGAGGTIVLGLIGLGVYALAGQKGQEPSAPPTPSALLEVSRPAIPKSELPREAKVQPPPPAAPSSEPETLTVKVKTLRVRSAPSDKAEIVERLSLGDQVVAHRQSGTWVEIARDGSVLGWVSEVGFQNPAMLPQIEKPKLETVLTAAAIAVMLVTASRQSYYASGRPCACPDDVMRNGRRCGGRSAYSRPGGASPLCYPGDVTTGMIEAFRARRASQ
ncbi:MAG: SH3 domain-containing protein [Candidatus Kaistia colombiensis]|nr:MAG: SH3 domain-containing protein [Kaistia sp.]